MPDRVKVYSGKETSDADSSKFYDVNLYVKDSLVQGNCTCLDFWNRGVVQGDLAYKCKHIRRAELKHAATQKPALVGTTVSNGNEIAVYHQAANNKFFVQITNLWSGTGKLSGMVAAEDVENAIANARKSIVGTKALDQAYEASRCRRPIGSGQKCTRNVAHMGLCYCL